MKPTVVTGSVGIVGAVGSVAVKVVSDINDSLLNEINRKRRSIAFDEAAEKERCDVAIASKQEEHQKTMRAFRACIDSLRIQTAKIPNYDDLKLDEETVFVAALGMTGNGKSTMMNRLWGDDSEDGDQGPFECGDNIHSQTQSIHSQSIQIDDNQWCLTDTPGLKDSNGEHKDNEHLNNLAVYLRRCDGVNALLYVMNGSNVRFDGNTRAMFKYYTQYFGEKGFWNHLIIILTNIEYKVKKQFNKSDRMKQLQDELHRTFPSEIKQNQEIAMIAVGMDSDYNLFRQQLIENVMKINDEFGKMKCTQIRSPIHEMEQLRDELGNKLGSLEQEIKEIQVRQRAAWQAGQEQLTKIDNPSLKEQFPLIFNRQGNVE